MVSTLPRSALYGPSDTRDQVATAQIILATGEKKYQDGFIKQFVKAIYGGALLTFGGNLALVVGSSPALQASDPGLAKILFAVVFPVGLIMISLLGMELVTSTMLTAFVSTLKRTTPLWFYPAILLVQTLGNLVGCLLYDAFLMHWTGEFASAPYSTYVQTVAIGKVVTPNAAQIFLRAIGCNILVSIAVWQGAQSREGISKIVAIHLPIFCFVACGFDHVVANMCFGPLALLLGTDSFTTGTYIVKSMLPSFAGNTVGSWFIGLPFVWWYLPSQPEQTDAEAQSPPSLSRKPSILWGSDKPVLLSK